MKKENKTIKFISSLIVVLTITSTILFSLPRKANAFFAIVHDPLNWIENAFTAGASGTSATANADNTTLHHIDEAQKVLTAITKVTLHSLLQKVTLSTVNWINSGFSGSPLYVQNPTSFFGDIGKLEVKTLVNEFGYNTINYPFGQAWALNIVNTYQNTLATDAQYSLSNVINDPVVLSQYQNNFNYGGWNAFYVNTQYPQNNYIGFTMMADQQLAMKLAGQVQNKIQQVQNTLSQGSGFLSPKTCTTNSNYNNMINEFKPPTFNNNVPYNVPDCISVPNSNTCSNQDAITAALTTYNNAYNEAQAAWAKTNACPPRADGSSGLIATTPGSVVGSHIMNSLDASGRLGEFDAALGNSIASIVDALTNHFMSQGLSALSGSIQSTTLPVDNWSYDGQTLGGTSNTQTLNIPQNVSVSVGKSTSTTMSGGTEPYNIQTQPDTTIATVSISGTNLTVTGVAQGTTTVTIGDSSSTMSTTTIQITVTSSSGNLTVDFNNPLALQKITANTTSATNITMSGGTLPYNIQAQPDSGIAMALITDNTLIIAGVAPGTTSVTVEDSSSPSSTITLQITIGNETPISSAVKNISVETDVITKTTISGGTTPYSIQIQPDPAVAAVSVYGNTLTVTGIGAGTTSVTLQDSYSPNETIDIPITVIPAPNIPTTGTPPSAPTTGTANSTGTTTTQ